MQQLARRTDLGLLGFASPTPAAAGTVGAGRARPANTRARISSSAATGSTLMRASGSAPPPVSTRTSATPNARWKTFCTASRFWMRA